MIGRAKSGGVMSARSDTSCLSRQVDWIVIGQAKSCGVMSARSDTSCLSRQVDGQSH